MSKQVGFGYARALPSRSSYNGYFAARQKQGEPRALENPGLAAPFVVLNSAFHMALPVIVGSPPLPQEHGSTRIRADTQSHGFDDKEKGEQRSVSKSDTSDSSSRNDMRMIEMELKKKALKAMSKSPTETEMPVLEASTPSLSISAAISASSSSTPSKTQTPIAQIRDDRENLFTISRELPVPPPRVVAVASTAESQLFAKQRRVSQPQTQHSSVVKMDIDKEEKHKHSRDKSSDNSNVIRIRGLPPLCSDSELFEMCSQFGAIRTCNVAQSGDMKGRIPATGMVSFVAAVSARKAADALNGTRLKEWVLQTKLTSSAPRSGNGSRPVSDTSMKRKPVLTPFVDMPSPPSLESESKTKKKKTTSAEAKPKEIERTEQMPTKPKSSSVSDSSMKGLMKSSNDVKMREASGKSGAERSTAEKKSSGSSDSKKGGGDKDRGKAKSDGNDGGGDRKRDRDERRDRGGGRRRDRDDRDKDKDKDRDKQRRRDKEREREREKKRRRRKSSSRSRSRSVSSGRRRRNAASHSRSRSRRRRRRSHSRSGSRSRRRRVERRAKTARRSASRSRSIVVAKTGRSTRKRSPRSRSGSRRRTARRSASRERKQTVRSKSHSHSRPRTELPSTTRKQSPAIGSPQTGDGGGVYLKVRDTRERILYLQGPIWLQKPDIYRLFGRFGDIESVTLLNDGGDMRRPNGQSFVRFKSKDDAETALRAMQNVYVSDPSGKYPDKLLKVYSKDNQTPKPVSKSPSPVKHSSYRSAAYTVRRAPSQQSYNRPTYERRESRSPHFRPTPRRGALSRDGPPSRGPPIRGPPIRGPPSRGPPSRGPMRRPPFDDRRMHFFVDCDGVSRVGGGAIAPPVVDRRDSILQHPEFGGRPPIFGSVLIQGLPPWFTRSALERLFAECGPIASATLMKNPANGHCNGSAYVSYEDWASANVAAAKLHGFEIDDNRALTESAAAKRKTYKMVVKPKATPWRARQQMSAQPPMALRKAGSYLRGVGVYLRGEEPYFSQPPPRATLSMAPPSMAAAPMARRYPARDGRICGDPDPDAGDILGGDVPMHGAMAGLRGATPLRRIVALKDEDEKEGIGGRLSAERPLATGSSVKASISGFRLEMWSIDSANGKELKVQVENDELKRRFSAQFDRSALINAGFSASIAMEEMIGAMSAAVCGTCAAVQCVVKLVNTDSIPEQSALSLATLLPVSLPTAANAALLQISESAALSPRHYYCLLKPDTWLHSAQRIDQLEKLVSRYSDMLEDSRKQISQLQSGSKHD